MSKLLKVTLPLALALLALSGCVDPTPGEVGMRTTFDGTPRACLVQVFNSKGKQLQQESADQFGVAYIKGLAPDTYTFKFMGTDNSMYKAVRTLKVTPGSSMHLDVDLNSEADAAGQSKAEAGGASGGSATDSTD
jgi:hypothetical protein